MTLLIPRGLRFDPQTGSCPQGNRGERRSPERLWTQRVRRHAPNLNERLLPSGVWPPGNDGDERKAVVGFSSCQVGYGITVRLR